ncbi:hypothetical protein E4Z66_01750 [Aliishimia ponticola]|uniref:Uncharacterized protein n=1 Tax=Aliishimia ponticola TaxID=2499833 RepID=A0A4S4NJA9_9RHOB|nr:hypothetical protein [Aliishimia ponticola]THH38321.1 hypothetical protein E4Z66_01750 [Aliishimia ponticola]
MTERYTLKKSLYVRASMFTADELRRQKRLDLKEVNEAVLEGLVKQREQLEAQQNNILRSLTISLFLAFIAWNGGNIQIPGTGASIADVPSFLELCLIAASLSVLMITYSFLSIQLYNAVIFAVASDVMAKNKLDPDLFTAARTPTWLFVKYCQSAPVNGREPGFRISAPGRIFYGVLVGFLSMILLALWLLAIASILYIAHTGLSDDLAGWVVYATCVSIIFASFIAMAANIIEFTHEMDFSVLEKTETDSGDLGS